MKTNTRSIKLAAVTLICAALPVFTGFSQSDESEDDNEIYELSPFTVDASEDTGYRATSTLAGTRIKTSLKDVGTSITVVTKEFLEDTGATDAADLLVYTPNTEVAGIGGNFSDSRQNGSWQNYGTSRNQTSSNRVRGLASADLTREYFATSIPFDSYNTDRVVINRGANAVLFGLGSPAGIINNSLAKANFDTYGEFEFRLGSYDTHREKIDYNYEVVDDRLALRLILLNENHNFQQRPAYKDQQRAFGSIIFKPTETSTIRAHYETGEIDSSMPFIDPPRDRLTTWWTMGKPTHDPSAIDYRDRFNGFNSMDSSRVPYIMYQDVTDTMGTNNFMHQVNEVQKGINTTNPNAADPSRTGKFRYGVVAPVNTQLLQERLTENPFAGFVRNGQILDDSIFDFRNRQLDGGNTFQTSEFDAYNVTLEQQFLEGDGGLELAFDKQDYEAGDLETLQGQRGRSISIDSNTHFYTGEPNPNFGRPFAASRLSRNESENERQSLRFTGFYKLNLEERMDGLWGRLLGRHDFTATYTEYEQDTQFLSGRPVLNSDEFGEIIGVTDSDNREREVGMLHYLGPSIANAASPVGANIPNVQATRSFPDELAWTYFNPESQQFESQTFDLIPYTEAFPISEGATGSISAFELESIALVAQSYWWDQNLVTTLGWREDSFESRSANNDLDAALNGTLPADPDLDGSESTVSFGAVLHTPQFIRESLPNGFDISLHYATSENFSASQVRTDYFGRTLSPPSGETEEYGFTLNLFENKFSARFNWYETKQTGITDPRMGLVQNGFLRLAHDVLENQTPEQLDAAGWRPLPQEIQDLYNFQVTRIPGGFHEVTYDQSNASEVRDAVTEGFEFEATYNPTKNWRMIFNASQQEAVVTGSGQIIAELYNDRLSLWAPNTPTGDLWTDLNVRTVSNLAFDQAINAYRTAVQQDGGLSDELREWRWNLITNYSFSEGALKGFGIGGAARWQDSQVIGFPLVDDPDLGLINDVSNPFYGSEQINYDGWISYARKLFDDKIDWRLQLNVKNLDDNEDLIKVFQQPDGSPGLYRIQEGRRWELTSSFRF